MADRRKDSSDELLESLKPKDKQLLDVLYSNNNMIAKIHWIKSQMIDAIASPSFLSSLSPEDWAEVMNALTESERVAGDYNINYAKLSEKAPAAVQNVFAILAGQVNTQVNAAPQQAVEAKQGYEIPSDVLPIQQALQTSLDSRFGIDRTSALNEFEHQEEKIIDSVEEPNNDQSK